MNKLQQFQLDNGLEPNGIVGKNTLNMIKICFNLTETETAHFTAQITHETGYFKYEEENLNYSKDALLKVFGKYFTEEQAEEYARKPEKIANRVYSNRMGNGDEESGDGWKYRGRGSLQLTGKNNYEIFANKVKDLRIIDNPELINKHYFFETAIHFFNHNNIWRFCKEVNKDSILKVSRAINIGNPYSSVIPNGFQDRYNLTMKYWNILKDAD